MINEISKHTVGDQHNTTSMWWLQLLFRLLSVVF